MSSSGKSFWNNRDAGLNSPNKMSLNPNAAEFVPSALRSLPGNKKKVNVPRLEVPGTSGKAVLDQSLSSISNNSDDEAHQYWHPQLPDDITPDFKSTGEELQAPGSLSLGGLSINDGMEASRFPMTMSSHPWGIHQEISPLGGENKSLSKRMGYSCLPYTEDHSLAAFVNLRTNPSEKQFMNADQHLTKSRECHYGGNSSAGFLNGLLSEHGALGNATGNPVEFLASQFPAFTAQSIAELYYENECNLNLTIEMLSQPQLKVDNSFNQKMNAKPFPAPSLELDFPALPAPDPQNKLSWYSGEDLQRAINAFRCVDKEGFSLFKSVPSGESMGTPDFASAVHRLASRESEHWNYEKNGAKDASTGTIINSQLLTSSHNGHGKTALADKLGGLGTTLAASSLVESGDAMAQVYSEMREEGRDIGHFRNSSFEQAKQAYIIGSKALAKELNVKGQLYSIQMKEAHEKARESIYRQRNPTAQLQSYNQTHDPLIDLHGLHVNEAIHVLKHEFNILRRTARSAGRRLQVMIRVNTGPHTRGSHNPVRLPIAIQQYLLDENLQFSEDQPGLLRVLIS